MIITVSTLLTLLQLIKRFMLHVVKTSKLTHSHGETFPNLLESVEMYG